MTQRNQRLNSVFNGRALDVLLNAVTAFFEIRGTIMKRHFLTLGVIAALTGPVLFTSNALAVQSTSGSMTITTNIDLGSCVLSAITPVDFGTLLPTAIVSQQFNYTIDCSDGLPYKVGIDAGLHPDLIGARRLLAVDPNGTYISYSISIGGALFGDSDLSSPTSPANGLSISSIGIGGPSQHLGAQVDIDLTGQTLTAGGAYNDTVAIIVEW